MTASVEVLTARTDLDGPETYAIEMEGVSIWFGRTAALRNLSMHVPRGSIYGFVGPRGAGKTTAMRTLATLQQPDTGSVHVDGIDIRADPAAARARIGYLPDSSGVYEGFTVGEYLDFYGAIYGISPRRRRQLIDELLELIGLSEQRNNHVGCLSRGMKQQLGLARCLVHDPQVLLLDEPASGMDPRSRLELRDMLQELAAIHKTILISSHILSDLAEVCTHLGILQAGGLVAEGRVDEIMDMVSPDARLRVRLLEATDEDVARRVLEAHPACGEIEGEGDRTLLAQFEGTQQDLGGILGQLCACGVHVIEFALQHRTLEDIVLQVTDIGDRT